MQCPSCGSDNTKPYIHVAQGRSIEDGLICEGCDHTFEYETTFVNDVDGDDE